MSSRKDVYEVERKFTATAKDWAPFVKLCRSFNPDKELIAEGSDTYYCRDNTYLRWRLSGDLSQLTIKERLSNRSSFIRAEKEVDMTNTAPRAVIAFIKAAGFQKMFRIQKRCHICYFHGEVSVVIYEVFGRDVDTRHFIEVEAEKGQDPDSAKRLVSKWCKELGLTEDQRIDATLFEIYSNRRTPMAAKRSA